jgi:alanine dehydrogenase
MDDIQKQAQELLKKGIGTGALGATIEAIQEKPLKVGTTQKGLIYGVPRETQPNERRVALAPGSVGVLVANGHQVIVEHDAGKFAQFSDTDYSENGALIAYTPEEIFSRSEVICKIAPLTKAELQLIQPNRTLISAVHLGGLQPDYLKKLIEKNVTAVGFEFILSADGTNPIMTALSEIAGITSIQIASGLLSAHEGGKGLLLGGVTGIPPTVVTVIGAGAVGFQAAKTALGLGATVKVIDEEVSQLRWLEKALGRKIYTVVAQQDYINEAVTSADVLIGAVYRKGSRAPLVVTEDMVASMREGSVIVDVAIDQGGCVETSHPTTHDNPTYIKHGVTHYCVPNIASRVPQTASIAISNILGPLMLKVGDAGGIKHAMAINPAIRNGIYTYHRHITQRSIATMFGMDFMDIELLHAVNL